MKSFLKAYIITLILAFALAVGVMLFVYRAGLENNADFVWNFIATTIAFQFGVNLVLMLVVALPFFAIVRKFADFSWLHSFIMWFLVFLCFKYGMEILFGQETFDTIRNLWLAAVFISVIFMPLYKAFKKREKPIVAKISDAKQVFE